MAAVIETCTQNARAVVFVLDQAEAAGLPDPASATADRTYDTEVSRKQARVRMLFTTFADIKAWASHLGADIVQKPGGFSLTHRTWHYEVAAEWLDVSMVLTAVTDQPAPYGEVTDVR